MEEIKVIRQLLSDRIRPEHGANASIQKYWGVFLSKCVHLIPKCSSNAIARSHPCEFSCIPSPTMSEDILSAVRRLSRDNWASYGVSVSTLHLTSGPSVLSSQRLSAKEFVRYADANSSVGTPGSRSIVRVFLPPVSFTPSSAGGGDARDWTDGKEREI